MANRPIATINGKDVYSSKRVDSIVNTRVTFTDGSWCDVATGEVVNRGSGHINVGAPSSNGGEKTTLGPKTYRATVLDVQRLEADVDIQPIDGQEMRVTIEGSNSAVENISVRLQDDTLVIQGKDSGGGHIRGADIVIRGGDIRIGGIVAGRIVVGQSSVIMSGGGENDTRVSIGVPKGSAVKVAGVQGNVNIGDTDGSLHAIVRGSDNIKAGRIRDATLLVQGSGSIDVDTVNDYLSMNIQGSGDIRVRSGSVGLLYAHVMGSGDARFNGQAVDANLSVNGSGDIDVAFVTNRPNKSVIGSGDVKVGNW